MEALTQQLKKGSLEINVMQCLAEQDCYGYELITMLNERSGGYYSFREGSLYPVLYRLESKQLVTNYQQIYEGERRVPRKYYRITERGLITLERMREAWEKHKEATDRLLGISNGGGKRQ